MAGDRSGFDSMKRQVEMMLADFTRIKDQPGEFLALKTRFDSFILDNQLVIGTTRIVRAEEDAMIPLPDDLAKIIRELDDKINENSHRLSLSEEQPLEDSQRLPDLKIYLPEGEVKNTPPTLAESLGKIQSEQKLLQDEVRKMLDHAKNISDFEGLEQIKEEFGSWLEENDLMIMGKNERVERGGDETSILKDLEKLIIELANTIDAKKDAEERAEERAEEKRRVGPYERLLEKLQVTPFDPKAIDSDLRKGVGITVTRKMNDNEKYIQALRKIIPEMNPDKRVQLANHLLKEDKTHTLQKHRYQVGTSTETLNMGIAQGILARGLDKADIDRLKFKPQRSHVKKAYQQEFTRVDESERISPAPRQRSK